MWLVQSQLIITKYCQNQLHVFPFGNDHANNGLRFCIGTGKIQRKDVVKFLGIHIDNKLIWKEHIKHFNLKIAMAKLHHHVAKVVNKASRILGLVRATFTCSDDTIVLLLFTTTILDYEGEKWR